MNGRLPVDDPVAAPRHVAATLYLVPRAVDRLHEGRQFAAPLLTDAASSADVAQALRGVHPDLIVLAPVDGKERIGIDQVREVIRAAQFSAAKAKRKVCLIPRAEALTPEAANALLNVMEEPPRQTAFVLLAEHPGDLLPTIVSRCRLIRVPPPGREASVQRLIDAGHSPERAAALTRVPLRDGDLERLALLGAEAQPPSDQPEACSLLDMIAAALGDDPIERDGALRSLVEQLLKQDVELLTVGVRALASQDREVLLRFLQELLETAFDRARSDRADTTGPTPLGPVDPLAVCRAVEEAHRSIVLHGPADAALFAMGLAARGDANGRQ